jgi:hypothetical protein
MATEEGKACAECVAGKANISGANLDLSLPSFDPLVGAFSGITKSAEKAIKEYTIDTVLAPIPIFLDLFTGDINVGNMGAKALNPDEVGDVLAFITGSITSAVTGVTGMLSTMLEISLNPVEGLKGIVFDPLYDNLGEPFNSISLKVPDFPSVPSFLVGLDFGDYGSDQTDGWEDSEAREKYSKFAMSGMLPNMDPLFFAIEKTLGPIQSIIEGLPVTIALGIAGVGQLVQDLNTIKVTFDDIMSIIPPTDFIKSKYLAYFTESGIQFPEGIDLDFPNLCTDCLMEQIPSLII